jgi:ATP-dependent Clp endopeptidase proteolytic subunit ClpP|mmetsp:Transcript_84105/g.132789  ORF Transcript_84105/g.132789 Transcript_84105/m.132789 type:complete len:315 (-) Transcript_84105:80-1024(-)
MPARITALACLFYMGHGGKLQSSNHESDRALSKLLLGANPAASFNPFRIKASAPQANSRSSLTSMKFKRVSDGQVFKWDAARGMHPVHEANTMMPEEKPEEPKAPPGVNLPMVGAGDDKVDVMSRLLRDRIILLGSQVTDEIANVLVAQMLYLAGEDPEKDITMYINSPGGSISAGMAIFDTMNFIPCDVSTVCFGGAASMGAFLLGAGTKGKRRALPNSRIMIHQPLGGAQGQADDIQIQAQEILYLRSLLNEYISDHTGQPLDKIGKDTDRDFFMTAQEAKEYGIIDEVLGSKIRIPQLKRPDLMETLSESS